MRSLVQLTLDLFEGLREPAPPDWRWPGIVTNATSNHMHVQLGDDVSQRGYIEFVEWPQLAQRSAGISYFVEQLMLLRSFEVGQFTQAVDARYQDQPGKARVVHQQNAAKGQVGNRQTVAIKLLVENE